MRRCFTAGLLLAVTLLFVPGCGSSEGDIEKEKEAATKVIPAPSGKPPGATVNKKTGKAKGTSPHM
jgi:hypothetical protein